MFHNQFSRYRYIANFGEAKAVTFSVNHKKDIFVFTTGQINVLSRFNIDSKKIESSYKGEKHIINKNIPHQDFNLLSVGKHVLACTPTGLIVWQIEEPSLQNTFYLPTQNLVKVCPYN